MTPLGETPLEAEQTETLRQFREREDAERERWRQEQESGIIAGEVTRPSSALSREGRARDRESRRKHQRPGSGDASDAYDSDEGSAAQPRGAAPATPFGFRAEAPPLFRAPAPQAPPQMPQDLQRAIRQHMRATTPQVGSGTTPQTEPRPVVAQSSHLSPAPFPSLDGGGANGEGAEEDPRYPDLYTPESLAAAVDVLFMSSFQIVPLPPPLLPAWHHLPQGRAVG